MVDGATADAPPRRRSSWSLSAIVEDVAGKPITDFQEPGRPTHPYLQAKAASLPAASRAPGTEREAPYDPVNRLYPPLVGAAGRDFHGEEHEHHTETLERHPAATPGPGERTRAPGPTHRPERLYLHYLLLHMDRLSDTALRYLRAAVEEEVAHRVRTPSEPVPIAGTGASTPPPPTPASAPPTNSAANAAPTPMP